MTNKLRIITLILFSIILISINFATSFSQKEEVNKGSRIEGIVSGVAGNILEISKGAIKVDISNAFLTKRGKEMKVEIIKPGMYIQIVDQEMGNNRESLRTNPVQLNLSQNEIRIMGEVLEVDYKAKKLRVFNKEIEVSEETNIQIIEKERERSSASFAKLKASKPARIVLSKQGKGLLAEEIYQGGNLTPYIFSQIEEIEGEQIKTLNNFYINTNNFSIRSALENGKNCKDVEKGSLKKGMLIGIYIKPENIQYNVDGSVIYTSDTKDEIGNTIITYLEDEGVIEGTVEEINLDKLRVKVGRQEIIIDRETIIVKDGQKNRVPFSNINESQRVFVIYKVVEGELRARYINLIEGSFYGSNSCDYN